MIFLLLGGSFFSFASGLGLTDYFDFWYALDGKATDKDYYFYHSHDLWRHQAHIETIVQKELEDVANDPVQWPSHKLYVPLNYSTCGDLTLDKPYTNTSNGRNFQCPTFSEKTGCDAECAGKMRKVYEGGKRNIPYSSMDSVQSFYDRLDYALFSEHGVVNEVMAAGELDLSIIMMTMGIRTTGPPPAGRLQLGFFWCFFLVGGGGERWKLIQGLPLRVGPRSFFWW